MVFLESYVYCIEVIIPQNQRVDPGLPKLWVLPLDSWKKGLGERYLIKAGNGKWRHDSPRVDSRQ